jgi:carboxyl-terminal processing protease
MAAVRAAGPAWEPPPPVARPAAGFAAIILVLVVFFVGVVVGSTGVLGRVAGAATAGSGVSSVTRASSATAQPAGGTEPVGSTVAGSQPSDAPPDFDLFWQALDVIEKNFVGRADVDPKQLTYGAIRGMVDALGDTGHSVFLTPDQAQAEQNALDQNVVGIGVLLGQRDNQTIVASVVPGSPAQQAGLKAGDVIVAVDGQSVAGLAPDELAAKVRGEAGTSVTVTIQRPATGEQLDFTIVRQQIKFPSVSWTMVPGTNIALLRMSQFAAGSADELQAARDAAIAAGANSLILDLRGNPGGYVDQAVKATSEFLHGKTVYVRQTADGQTIPVLTDDSVSSTDLPLVVLIDANTASSAEIMSGAIKSAGRGPLVGETTFGTGTVLLPFTLSDGSVVRLAVERWLTPDGELIFAKGVTPTDPIALAPNDVAVEPDDLRNVAPDQLSTITDTQLLRAIDLAGGPKYSPPPGLASPPATVSPATSP